MSPNTEYLQLAALGAWCEKNPLPAVPSETSSPVPEPVDEHVGAAETPNQEYSQLAALGRYFDTHPH